VRLFFASSAPQRIGILFADPGWYRGGLLAAVGLLRRDCYRGGYVAQTLQRKERPLILVVEDEPQVRTVVRMNLEADGYVVAECATGREALEQVRALNPDLTILDVMLPGLSGLEVCRQIRSERGQGDLILMLTALAEEVDIVLGLEVGADDYLTKPFGSKEFRARVRALLRRGLAIESEERRIPLTARVYIDLDQRVVKHSGGEIAMTGKEFDLLVQLARRPGRVFSRQELLNSVWGMDFVGIDRTVDTHVTRVRKKLRQALGNQEVIDTVHGVGYRFRRIA
jgi:two-component system alkaline phosphatase synthesis response regulator PhoP